MPLQETPLGLVPRKMRHTGLRTRRMAWGKSAGAAVIAASYLSLFLTVPAMAEEQPAPPSVEAPKEATATATSGKDVVTVPVLLLKETRAKNQPISLLDIAPADDGIAGAKLGIADNTFVMYGTDNGPHMNSWPDGAMTPFRSEKNTNWEGAFRVPMLVRWPGKIKPGEVSTEIVQHHDWFPTFLAMAGEPDIVVAALEANKACQHASLGRAVGGEPRLAQAQAGEIVGELSMQKARGVDAAGAEHGAVSQAHGAVDGAAGGRGRGGGHG